MNQGSSSGSNIKMIIVSILGLGIIAFIIIYSILKSKKDEIETTGGKSAEARINIGLEVYKKYFNMNQLPLPNNGIYFN